MKEFTITLIVILCLHSGEVHGLTGGEPANEGEFPFVVSVKDQFHCHVMSGTIIGSIWVLSNAGGYDQLPGGSVGYGFTTLTNNDTFYCGPYDTITHRKIDNFYINNIAWDANPWTHDLVLILLELPITFGLNAQPVRLPEGYESWPYGETGTMVGWGYEGNTFPEIQANLQKANVSTKSDEFCSDTSLWNGYDLFFPAVMKCGGEPNKTFFCTYDYGGPFLINGTQYGIISYAYTKPGGNCGDYYGIFAPTVTFRDWITKITGI